MEKIVPLFSLGLVNLVLALSASPAVAREETPLVADWSFHKGEETNAVASTFDNSSWQKVTLPHNWGWEEAQVTKNYYRGPGWYRRKLEITPEPGKRYFIRFEAASSVAEVYLNGTKLGDHRGGFGAFCFELTDQLNKEGKDNTLAVRVSNAKELDLAPLSGDFCIFGGLYRPVQLIVLDQVCFTPLDHGSSGVFWKQTHVSKSEATLDLTAEISNGSTNSASRTLVAKIVDAAGKAVAETSEKIEISALNTPAYHLQLTLKDPHLWNGRKDPYLYHAVAELKTQEGTVSDSVDQTLGLRFFSIDPDKGFFLNGEPYRLKGVNRHQDIWNKGWALSHTDHERDVQLICEMGANAVRCAHYQHSGDFYSLCDQAGLLVWAEIPLVNEITPGAAFAETSRNQLLDLIRQNQNHPSIFAWSLYNEINPRKNDPHRLLQDLNLLAKGEDPARPTIAGCCHNSPTMPKIPDLLGKNLYEGWYGGSPESLGQRLDSLRNASQHGGLCVSEYGAGANPLQHELPAHKPEKTSGPWHPEEWQGIVHERNWAAIKERPFVWGSFVWSMFDFVTPQRNEGSVPCRNDKGLITTDRQLKKDAFYFYQANWSEQPVLHITSQRFAERTNAVTSIKIYSNADSVDLLINGKSAGQPTTTTNATMIWNDVTLAPGENKIEAHANHDGKPLHDQCVWTLKQIATPLK